jgi:hypothetical protein
MEVLVSQDVRDRNVAQLLLDLLRITTHAGTWSIVDRYFPDAEILARARLHIEDLLFQL